MPQSGTEHRISPPILYKNINDGMSQGDTEARKEKAGKIRSIIIALCIIKIAQYAIFCYKSAGREIYLDRERRKQYTLV